MKILSLLKVGFVLLGFIPTLVFAQGAPATLGGHVYQKPTIQDIYNISNCFEPKPENWKKFPCCNPCGKRKCCDKKPAFWAEFDYWEPSAIVEVSCRNGFSFLKPGMGGRGNAQQQSCQQGPNWFFEARVWTSSGKGGKDRSAAMGENARLQTMQCEANGTTGNKKYPNGYGIKHKGIIFNSSGPSGSSEAYISDTDPEWAKGTTGGAAAQPSGQCQQGSPDIEKCWGQVTENGWVTHPNRAVAAALVSYRALMKGQKAGKVVKPIKSGWKMSMDYPFISQPGPYTEAMGMTGGGGKRTKGSDCFKPGDPGFKWYTAGKKDENAQQLMNRAQIPPATTVAEIDPNTYIFVYWSRTGCKVYTEQGPLCIDNYKY